MDLKCFCVNVNVRGRGCPHNINKHFSGYQQSALQFNSILTASARRRHHLPQLQRLVPQDCFPPGCHTSDSSSKPRLLPGFWPISSTSGGLMTPSSFNSLQQLTKFKRITFCFLHYHFIIKRYIYIIKGQSNKRDTWGEVCRKGYHSPQMSMNVPIRKLSEAFGFL